MGCGTRKTSLQLEWTQVLDLTEPYEGTAPFARPAFNCYFLLTCFFEAKTDVIYIFFLVTKTDVIFQLVLLWLFYYFLLLLFYLII